MRVEVGREALARSHPGSLVHGEELHSHLYFELSALFQYEEKQQQSEVCFPSFQRTTVKNGKLRCQVGGETWQGEMSWQTRKRGTLGSSLP